MQAEVLEHKLSMHRLAVVAASLSLLYLAADCGAGVGRVSEQLLLHSFQTVDLLEPSKHLLDTAQQKLGAGMARGNFPRGHKLGLCLCQGLQEFEPQPQRCAHWAHVRAGGALLGPGC